MSTNQPQTEGTFNLENTINIANMIIYPVTYSEIYTLSSQDSILAITNEITRLYPIAQRFIRLNTSAMNYANNHHYTQNIQIQVRSSNSWFRSIFSSNIDEALRSIGERLLKSIQDSQVQVDDAQIIFSFIYVDLEDMAFGSKNSFEEVYKDWVVISHKTYKSCILASLIHGEIIHRFNEQMNKSKADLSDYEYAVKNFSKKVKDTKIRIQKKNLTLNQKISSDVPKIIEYFSNYSKTKYAITVHIYNEVFNKIDTYYPPNETNKKITICLRKFDTHVMLIVPIIKLDGSKQKNLNTQLESKLMHDHTELRCVGDVENEKVYKNERGVLLYKDKMFETEYEMVEYLISKNIFPYTFGRDLIPITKLGAIKSTFLQKNTKNIEELSHDMLKLDCYAAYDIETYTNVSENPNENEQVPYMIGLAYYKEPYDRENYKVKTWDTSKEDCLEGFFDYIAINADFFKDVKFFAHNGGKFDSFILLKYYLLMDHSKWKLDSSKFIFTNGGIIGFSLVLKCNPKIKIHFRDSFRYMSSSLKKLTKDFNVKHKKLDYDIGDITKFSWLGKKVEIKKYLEHDCLGLLEILDIFREKMYDAGNIDIFNYLTTPSIACNIFLKKFYNPEKTPLFEVDYMLDSIIRAFYFGGRTESFVIGDFSNITAFMKDFNSLYPKVMLNDLPYGVPEVYTTKEMFTEGLISRTIIESQDQCYMEDKISEKCFGFVWVIVKTKENYDKKSKSGFALPRLHAYHTGERLLFPDFDEFTDILVWSEELKLSQKYELQYDYEIKGCIQYQREAFLAGYVTQFYAEKQKAGQLKLAASKLVYKLLLNSLYGIFGIKKRRNCMVLYNRIQDDDSNLVEKLWKAGKLTNIEYMSVNDEEMNNLLIEFEDYISSKCCVTSVASAITAYARCYQFEFQYRMLTEIPHTRILFGDTDSTCYEFVGKNHEKQIAYDALMDSSLYKDFFIGGAQDIIGKQKDEMQDYFENANISRDDMDKYVASHGFNIDPVKENNYPCNRVICAGSKMYFLGVEFEDIYIAKTALKGFRKNENQKITTKLFQDLFSDKGLVHQQQQWNRDKTEMSIKINKVEKIFHAIYLKGNIEEYQEKEESDDDDDDVTDIDTDSEDYNMVFDFPEISSVFDEFDEIDSYGSMLNENGKRHREQNDDDDKDKDDEDKKEKPIKEGCQYYIKPYKVSTLEQKEDRKFPISKFMFYQKSYKRNNS